jgi:hypothetical protein
MKIFTRVFLLFVVIISACSTPGVAGLEDTPSPTLDQATNTAAPPTSTPTATVTEPIDPTTTSPAPTATIEPTPTPPPEPTPTLAAEAWKSMPVIPVPSDRVVEIYQRGLELGNNMGAFSKIGDCGSTPAWFLGDFDRGTRYYTLGEHEYLTAVIDEFQGSYDRTSLAAKSGFNASSIFAPIWADRSQCQPNEAPILCEYRNHNPAFAFIMLGTNDVWHKDSFEPQMRKIIELSIDNGIIPILSTKADNYEGDESINAIIASLAYEYEIPLWNYWLAVQPLPNQGLQDDGTHLTWGSNHFDNPRAMQKAWPVRNLTALQVLDTVWRTAVGE